MPRARTSQIDRQTAAPQQEQGSGCFSGFMLVPLSVIFISTLLAALAMKTAPIPSSRVDLPPSTSPGIALIFTPEIQYWAEDIAQWAAASQLDPNLVATIMQIESCGDPRAISSAGAMGLFQVMPFHFAASDSPYDPDTNAARGLAYLVRSLQAGGGDARLALAGYNGGIGILSRAEWTWPAQTKRYIQYGVPIYQDARNGLTHSEAVTEWHETYGASLCRQAHNRLGLP